MLRGCQQALIIINRGSKLEPIMMIQLKLHGAAQVMHQFPQELLFDLCVIFR